MDKLSNLLGLKPKEPKRKPQWIRAVTCYLICAVLHLRRGELYEDAEIFANFANDWLSEDAEKGFRDVTTTFRKPKGRIANLEAAMQLLKMAAQELSILVRREVGENDRWDLFMEEVKAMKKRHEKEKEEYETLNGLDDTMQKIKDGDEDTIRKVLELAEEVEEEEEADDDDDEDEEEEE